MQKIGDTLVLSASDLVGHLWCGHLTQLDMEVAKGMLSKPGRWDPLLEMLQQRGALHELEYVNFLRATGFEITVVDGRGVDDKAISSTVNAMRRGDPIIVQGALRTNTWVGRPDILRKIDLPNNLGTWSYEVIDTKLARETKGATVLQLCRYSDLVAAVQGVSPEKSHVPAWTILPSMRCLGRF